MQRLRSKLSVLFVVALLWTRAGDLLPRARAQASGKAEFQSYGRQVALCVGINIYMFPAQIESTRCGDADALAVGNLLAERFGFEVERLTEEKATHEAVLGRLKEIGQGLGERDVLVLFFAGHGQILELTDPEGRDPAERHGYLIPYDARLDLSIVRDPARLRAMGKESRAATVRQWDAQAINMRAIVEQLKGVKAQHVLVIVDACFSGFMTHLGGPIFPDRPDLTEMLRRKSRTVVAATTENSKAIVPVGNSLSVFTAHLVDRLKAGDPASLTEVFLDVRRKVAAETRGLEESLRMLPQRGDFGGDGGEFVFIPKGAAVAEIVPRARLSYYRSLGLAGGVTALADVIRAFQVVDYHFGTHQIEQERVWKERVERYEVAASLGDALSMAALHYCYSRGLGVPRDPAAAYRWAVKAFDTGRPEGKHVLGRCLLTGIGVEKNEAAGERLIRAAAAADFPISQFTMALRGLPAAGGLDAAAVAASKALFEKAAAGGVPAAKSRLGHLHAGTLPGTTRDIAAGMRLFTEAAEEGDASANLILYDVYSMGQPDLAADLRKAETALRRGAEEGDASCQIYLAYEYFPSSGFPPTYGYKPRLGLKKDLNEALKWGELAASQGHNPARVYLADLYEGVPGVPARPDRARELCELAARDSYPPAQVKLGNWYEGAKIFPRDYSKAFTCYRTAADMGDFMGYAHLSRLYENALGVDLGGHPRMAMIPYFQHHQIHCLIQSYTIAKRQGVTHSQVVKKLKEFAGEVRLEAGGIPFSRGLEPGPNDSLQSLKRQYPDSYRLFIEEFKPK